MDVSKDHLKKNDFSTLMSGYAEAFTSSAVIDSISSGQTGRIAVALMFFGGESSDSLAVPWMSIGSLSEARMFASQLTKLTRPGSGNFTFAEAMNTGVSAFGTETGAADNGFQSLVQLVEISAVSRPDEPNRVTEGASQDALKAGVDLIGAVALGKKADQVEAYYQASVVGGEIGGVIGSATSGDLGKGLSLIFSERISSGVAGASAVPEPSAALLFASSVGMLLVLRRRT